MRRITLLAVACAAAAACSDSSIAPTAPVADVTPLAAGTAESNDPGSIRVTNSNDAGPGSFRDAVEQANANSAITVIRIRWGLGVIHLETPVNYWGRQALFIDGGQAILDGSALPGTESAFVSDGGGNLSIANLGVRSAPGSGITVELPSSSSGIKTVTLNGLDIRDNGGHGVVINDQFFPEEAGNPDATPPVPPNSAGSPASLRVVVNKSTFHHNGYGAPDRDGLRINEGGAGDLIVIMKSVIASENGADGIELDERGAGDVNFELSESRLSRNGSFTTVDLDDGIDVDESGAGSLIGVVRKTNASDNFEEGLDFNENDAGDFRVEMMHVEASRNREEGIDFEEDDDFAGGGHLVTTLYDIKANGNAAGDAGLKIREKGEGNLVAEIMRVETSDNRTSGIQVREDAAGSMSANVQHATANHNSNHGIDFDENAGGDLTAIVVKSSSTNNTGFGVRADNAGAGVGALTLQTVILTGNGAGPVGGAGVTVTQTP